MYLTGILEAKGKAKCAFEDSDYRKAKDTLHAIKITHICQILKMLHDRINASSCYLHTAGKILKDKNYGN